MNFCSGLIDSKNDVSFEKTYPGRFRTLHNFYMASRQYYLLAVDFFNRNNLLRLRDYHRASKLQLGTAIDRFLFVDSQLFAFVIRYSFSKCRVRKGGSHSELSILISSTLKRFWTIHANNKKDLSPKHPHKLEHFHNNANDKKSRYNFSIRTVVFFISVVFFSLPDNVARHISTSFAGLEICIAVGV